ncbi:MAG TPA: energy transducer TonB [Gemmatimonadales bacterium]|nr:energy transducer TonB [Gemmatimonadales bacterium]
MESQRTTYRSLALLCLLGLVATAAWSAPARKTPDGVSGWNDRLQAARTHLIAGEHKKALGITRDLQSEMVDRIWTGPGAAKALAVTTLSRALAEAGLGDLEAAEWDWYTAQTIDPVVLTLDLAPFGAAGATVKSFPDLTKTDDTPYPAEKEVRDPAKACDPKKEPCVQKPELLKRSDLSYPEALASACAEGVVVVESIIDENGKIRYPRLKESPGNPVMAFAALESLRSWRYKPAMFEGKPVKVYYTLTVNFRATSKGCLDRRKAG